MQEIDMLNMIDDWGLTKTQNRQLIIMLGGTPIIRVNFNNMILTGRVLFFYNLNVEVANVNIEVIDSYEYLPKENQRKLCLFINEHRE